MAIKIIVLFFNFLFLNYLLHMYMGSFPVIIKSPSQFIKEFEDSKHSPTVTGFLFANPFAAALFPARGAQGKNLLVYEDRCFHTTPPKSLCF